MNCIVVGVDGSELSQKALRIAATIAGGNDARVIVVHVRPQVSEVEAGTAALEGEVRQVFGRVIRSVGARAWRFEVRVGDPGEELVAVARKHGADLIVVGSCAGGESAGQHLGSVARRLVDHAPLSVLLIR